MNLIILGPPGSGKGTQAKLIAQKYDLNHISTGELFRREVKSGSEFGQHIKSFIDTGELVPDNILFSILEKEPLTEDKGFILDGTPRNIEQAKELENVLQRVGIKADKVIYLNIPRQVSLDRLLKRAKQENRSDDTRKVIEERLDVYENETSPVIDFYRSQNKLVEIDGTPDITTIFETISRELKAVK